MPRRTDIDSILIIGAGPIIIGQACEFDYSGAQACKALREEGFRVILVNSNPATIMVLKPASAAASSQSRISAAPMPRRAQDGWTKKARIRAGSRAGSSTLSAAELWP